MDTEEAKGPTPTETLFGGADLVVGKLDGAKETVRIKQLTIFDFPALLASQDDEVAIACLYTGRDQKWFATVALPSQEQVIIEGDRINADFFVRWFQRRVAKGERMVPGVTEKALAQVTAPAPRPASVNTAPPLRRQPA